MRQAIQFYAPDWELVLLWCAIGIPSCLAVLLMSRLFGRSGALAATVALAIMGLGIPIFLSALGPGLHILWSLVLSPPLLLGAFVGFAFRLLR